MSVYSDYLKSQGATDADIAVLDTPIAQRAFDKLQAEAAENARLLGIAKADFDKMDTWYKEAALPSYSAMQQRVIAAEAEAARNAAIVKAATDEGLLEISKTMTRETTPNTNPNPGNPGFDPNKYVTTERITQFVDEAGNGLARMQDVVLEHMQLFPNVRLNVATLRAEAVAARKDFATYWEQKYNVPAARAAADKTARDAEIAKWKAEGAAEKETELVSKFGNPDTRPMSPSTNTLTRIAQKDREAGSKMPWDRGSREQLASDRVSKATGNFLKDMARPN